MNRNPILVAASFCLLALGAWVLFSTGSCSPEPATTPTVPAVVAAVPPAVLPAVVEPVKERDSLAGGLYNAEAKDAFLESLSIEDQQRVIKLKSRYILPAKAYARGAEGGQAFVEFSRHLTQAEKEEMAKLGVHLGAPYTGKSYRAMLEPGAWDRIKDRPEIVGIAEVQAVDKMEESLHQILRMAGPVAEQKMRIAVEMAPGVQDAVTVCRNAGIETDGKKFGRFAIEARATRSQIEKLVSLNDVAYVSYIDFKKSTTSNTLGSMVPGETNYNAQLLSNVAILHQAPYSLLGNGVNICEIDGGAVLETHEALAPRVSLEETGGYSDHATHVAGTMIADPPAEHANAQGMAPQAFVFSYDFNDDGFDDYVDAVTNNACVTSNNSWGYQTGAEGGTFVWPETAFGAYDAYTATWDDLVYTYDVTVCKASGNDRNDSAEKETGFAPPFTISGDQGTVYQSGEYEIHVYNYAGPRGGRQTPYTFTPDPGGTGYSIEYLLVGGGGAGGPSLNRTTTNVFRAGGGGGGGGVVTNSTPLIPGTTYRILVGEGGLKEAGLGDDPNEVATLRNGNPSTFGVLNGVQIAYARGGGGGGNGEAGNGANGASGGGSGRGETVVYGLGQQGKNGAVGAAGFADTAGAGGGGGAVTAGMAGTAEKGGDGGNGVISSITGGAVYYGGGGGGARAWYEIVGNNTNGNPGLGGLGGGGDGGYGPGWPILTPPFPPGFYHGLGEDGIDGTGGGGGGGSTTDDPTYDILRPSQLGWGGDGGDGVFIFRVKMVPAVIYDGHDGKLIQTNLISPYFDCIPPWGCAKNIITVGALTDNGEPTIFSSTGPTDDFRIKPDVAANGDMLESTDSTADDAYVSMSGTSMACPVVTGITALLIEAYRNAYEGANPVAMMVKGLLVQTAVDKWHAGPDCVYGFGLVNARAAVDLLQANAAAAPGEEYIVDTANTAADDSLDTGEVLEYSFPIAAGTPLWRVTLLWLDPAGPAGADLAIVNDLDLELIAPNGTVYFPYRIYKQNPAALALKLSALNPTAATRENYRNKVDTVEQVEVANPMEGLWVARVRGTSIPQGPQEFVLLSNLPQGTPTVTVAATDNIASETPVDYGTFTFTRTGALGIAWTAPYSVTGTATSGTDYASLGSSVTFAPGQATVTKDVKPVDDAIPELTETVIVTMAGSGSTATVSILDNEVPRITIAATDPTATEGGDTATYTLTRLGRLDVDVTVNLRWSGTAVYGADFTTAPALPLPPPPLTVTIPAGAQTLDVVLTALPDGVAELSETAVLTVLTGAGYTVGTPSSATVTILDGDPPMVSIAATDPIAKETLVGSTPNYGVFTFTRFGGNDPNMVNPLTVNYTVNAASTALAGPDYLVLPGTVVIPAGQRSVTVNVIPSDDGISEPDETVIVDLAAGAYIIDPINNTATVTLEDNDTPIVTVTATDDTATEPTPTDTGTFTFTRVSGDKAKAFYIKYVVTGTATPGSDYTSLGTMVYLAANKVTVTKIVTPINNTVPEPAETVIVTLAGGTGYLIGAPNTATVTINDND